MTELRGYIPAVVAAYNWWFSFVGQPAIGGGDLFELVGRAMGSQPWLVIGAAGVVVVQLLTFGRRARI